MYRSNLFVCVMSTLDAGLEVKEAILTTKKTKYEIKKELEGSIANDKKNENTDIEEITNNFTEGQEDVAKVIHEFEEIIKNKKR